MGSWLVSVLKNFEKKKTLPVTENLKTKNIFILNNYVIYVFLTIHIDDRHYSNIAKLKN
jgi:hypothetical protein